ncbi:hypothetical protein, partial [Chryseobacterium sp. SIMBA_029]|uniref:hypothetical protein n=1 Tax=Chryseobacterium sp. SIMBA_029 TaxID=3085772 RepID=UPI00397A5FFD
GRCHSGIRLPLEVTSMLMLLIALAVFISLAGEIAYGVYKEKYEVRWVRPEVSEHHALMRQLGRLR